MADSEPTPRPPSPGDSLPPVEPPSAAFLVQLFLIPGLIVGIIVLVWSLFHWLADTGGVNPQKYVQKLLTDSPDLWQTAEHLAEMLRNDRRNELRGDPKLAAELADVLQQRIARGQLDEEAVNLRVYLSSALGWFNTPVVLPALLQAATTNRDPAELPVRRAALDAIGILVENTRGLAPFAESAASIEAAQKVPVPLAPSDNRQLTTDNSSFADPAFLDALLKLSHDPEPVIRLRAAYVLGVLGGPKSLDRLAQLLDDPYVTYNAATGLARHGDARALDQLQRMLSPDQTAAVSSEEKNQQDEKRWLIVLNGLRAVEQLAEANPKADLSRFTPAAKALETANPPAAVRDESLRVGEMLEKRGSGKP
jgi:HEAT repeats